MEHYKWTGGGNNVHYKGQVCYTEDSVLVHNLYLSNLPHFVDEDAVANHFAGYGEVESVKILERRNRSSGKILFRYGFVNYKDAESAARALKTQPHMFFHHRITVKAADSWKQPDIINRETNQPNPGSKENPCPEETELDANSILRLNDDCLLHIFAFLSLNEQLKLSSLCERFRYIFEMVFRQTKSLNMYAYGNLTLMEVRQIMTQVGKHIQEAHLEGYEHKIQTNYSRCLEFMTHSCPNLRWLDLSAVNNVHRGIYRRISGSLKNLTKVELRNCALNDLVCSYLSLLPILDTLDVSENYELTGKFLSKFPSLTRLNLSQCANIQSKHFSELCKRGKLISLNVKRCDRLNKFNFVEMEMSLNSLEELVISSSYETDDLYHIAGLKNLKDLTIYFSQSLRDNLFESLAKYKADTLETLVLIASFLNQSQKEHICSLKNLKKLGILRDVQMDDAFLNRIATLPELTSLNIAGCSHVSRTGLMSLFKKPSKLQNVDISCCQQVYAETIHDIVDVVKKSNRTTPCKLYIGNTNVSTDITSDPKYRECAELLPLSFKICEFGVSFELLDDEDDYLSDEDIYNDIYDYYDSDEDDDLYDLGYDPHFVYGEDFPLFWF